MQRVNKKCLKKFYEEEAKHLAHQEMMYLKGNKHELWWHRKRLYYIVSFLSEIFEKNQITTFADIGCAEGFYVKYIASIHDEIFCVGADIAHKYIEKARRKGKTLNIGYIVCDVADLPFEDNSIDVLLCSEVLEHVHNYGGSLAELCRVAKKYLVLSFPGHSYLYKVVSKIKSGKKLADNLVRASDVGHVSEVKVSHVKEFLKGKCKCLKTKIGGTIPLELFEIIPSIRLVDVIDNMICKVLEHFGAVDYATIHVMEIVVDKS